MRRPLALISVLSVAAATSLQAGSVELLRRVKLGSYIEDLAYIPDGPLAHQIAFVDGFAVRAVPDGSGRRGPARLLFDYRNLPLRTPLNGLAWVASEGAFAAVTGSDPSSLLLLGPAGDLLETRSLQFDPGAPPHHLEGLAYIPTDAPAYPDHLAVVALDDNPAPSIRILTRQGFEVAALSVPEDLFPGFDVIYGYGLGYVTPGTLWISIWTSPTTLLALDLFTGEVVGNSVLDSDVMAEGIVQLEDGRVALGRADSIQFYDADLNRLASPGLDVGAAPGLTQPHGIAWDPEGRLLVAAWLEETSVWSYDSRLVAGLSPDGRGTAPVLPYGQGADIIETYRVTTLTYLPEEHLVALTRRWTGFSSDDPPEITLYDEESGLEVEHLELPFWRRRVGATTWIPAIQQFVINADSHDHVYWLDRGGLPLWDVNLFSTGLSEVAALSAFDVIDPPEMKLLVFDWDSSQAVVTNPFGELLGSFDYRSELGLVQPHGLATISDGPKLATFAAVDRGANEMLVFRLHKDRLLLGPATVRFAWAIALDGAPAACDEVGARYVRAAARGAIRSTEFEFDCEQGSAEIEVPAGWVDLRLDLADDGGNVLASASQYPWTRPGELVDLGAIEFRIESDLPHHQYVFDSLTLPQTPAQSFELGLDLDGDLEPDNAFGMMLATLGLADQTAMDEAIARGEAIVLADLQAEELTDAPFAVLRTYIGGDPSTPPCTDPGDPVCGHHLDGMTSFSVWLGPLPGEPGVEGRIASSSFTGGPGPGYSVFGIAPLAYPYLLLNGPRAEAQVAPGSLDQGRIGGGIQPLDALWAATYMIQNVVARDCPGTAPACCVAASQGEGFLALLDGDGDCWVSEEEVSGNALISSLLAPDVDLLDGDGFPGTDGVPESVSFGVGFTALGAVIVP